MQNQNIQSNYLSTGGLQNAENVWIKSVQRKFAKNKWNIEQLQIKLGIYLDQEYICQENIWRCKVL